MTSTFTNLFSSQKATGNTSSTLAGTQDLTREASAIVEDVIHQMNLDMPKYSDRILLSQSKMEVLDELINEIHPMESENVDFLVALDEATLDSMLKSQQSKRSRCKSKEMNTENYKSMMSAAVAEMLIRKATGKEKGTSGRVGGTLEYSEKRLQELADDQDALRKEIRNVQSKKSIMKNKAGFDESNPDDRWLALCTAEEQLKSVRSDGNVVVRIEYVDATKNKLQEMLAEVEPLTMKSADLKELVSIIKNLVFLPDDEEVIEGQPVDESTNETAE
jgi:hypothetical protein